MKRKKRAKKNDLIMEARFVIIASIIPIILQVLLFSTQLMKGIVSLWNIVGTIGVIALLINAIRVAFLSAKKIDDKNYDKKDIINAKNIAAASNNRGVGVILTQIILIIASVSLSILFFNIYNNKSENLQVINSVVVSQTGKVTTSTEYSSDGVTTTSSEFVKATIEYEFNGEVKQAIVTSNTTNKIYVNNLKIFVTNEGEFVTDYGRIMLWKYLGIILACFAGLMLLVFIFKLGSEFMAGVIFSGIAFIIFLLIGFQLIENLLYNDLACFCSAFTNIGLYMIICGTLTALFGRKVKDDESFAVLETINETENTTNETDDNNSEYSKVQDELEEKYQYCEFCSSRVNPTDKFCENCGSKIIK